MKLLFDENVSPQLVRLLADLYPDSAHVHQCGLGAGDDEAVWRYAAEHGFVIVTKDVDFYHRSVRLGHPPKVLWIRLGNCPTSLIEASLRMRYTALLRFERDTDASCFVVS